MHTRFKWYNIRRPAVDPKQADPTYYENLALSVPLAQGYIDRLGEIWFEMVSVSRDKIVNDEAESRLVYHYQFLAWPDHGVPPNPGTVVNFLEEINQLESGMTDKRPLIVHCSAGIGRTGTFIAIDLILCFIRKYGLQCTIDIRRTVQMLRSQRSGMVQTEAQYKFVYMSVHYYIDTFAKLLHEHKRIEDTGHEYTNIRYSAEAASNQVNIYF
ncbi:Tyrosine-protein phosphatase non-receptor type 11, partial [Trichinella spiralis]